MKITELSKLTAAELSQKLLNKEVSAVEVTKNSLEQSQAIDEKLGAFLTFTPEQALETAKKVDQKLQNGEELPKLAGIPIGYKDLFVTKGVETTASSQILKGWIPPYTATIIEKLEQNLVPMIGKTNCDEFAMGSSTETSGYKLTYNPYDLSRIPGGSSGGSAACVAGFETTLSLGTDTGGSIRQPAAVCGCVGFKGTYGSVSRYGIIALASSLDQAGPFTRSVKDAALLQEVIQGFDPKDSTSIPDFSADLSGAVEKGVNDLENNQLKGKKVGYIKQLMGEGFQAGVNEVYQQTLKKLEDQGIELIEIDLPDLKYALGAYYIIQPAECSSNLAKFDGVRFGLRSIPPDLENTTENMMRETRKNGFGWETKRRILLGTYALSAGYYDAFYGSAMKVRTLLIEKFTEAFEKVDVLITPTSPNVAFKIGEKISDPMTMYMNDIATIPVNLIGAPGMSVPIGLAKDPNDSGDSNSPDLPVGLQIIGNPLDDEKVFYYGSIVEQLANYIHQPSAILSGS